MEKKNGYYWMDFAGERELVKVQKCGVTGEFQAERFGTEVTFDMEDADWAKAEKAFVD